MADRAPAPPLTRSEWGLLLVLVAVQFTHMVDFVIIMPLGHRLQQELGIDPAQFGSVVAAYAWAAGIASLVAASVIDRFDRRTALLALYGGFAVSTLLCGLARDYGELLAGRTLAGVFGGLAAVTLMAVIGDVFPPEKRGRASGAVVSSFAAASVLGLPVGLKFAELYGRGAPFVVLAGFSGLVWLVAWVQLPPVRGHMGGPRRHPVAEFNAVVRVPNHLWGFAFSFFLVLGTFTVAAFIAPVYTRANGWSEGTLAGIYFVAGLCTLVGTNVVGRLADRFPRLALFRVLAGAAMVMAVVVGYVTQVSFWGGAALVSGFMVAAAGRMVPAQAMLLGASAPATRGSFMSLNTAVQHAATGLAPVLAGAILTRYPDGFPVVGWVAAGTAAVSLVLAGKLKPAAAPVAPAAAA
ncbi:MFS transporter [Urbifossiella limnaea]|uniref:Purine efflux pump PbuE n=1 Tax=Urbifossiella limnaea TaxID=2528023 RepID=A0A517XUL2_9BACT|nr:MFS transporter [Urbifossiella limnaea]QDU21180.1 Purine efflux pump PbuE [Urbifossiella limnaea]